MTVVWALACMVLAALNDLVFKFYARKPRPQGMFVSIVGGGWMICSLFFLQGTPENWQATVMWGMISGFLSVTANILMLDAMKSLDAGVCSMIYRLNLVPVTIGAALILKENISLMQYIGIGCACLAVVAFIPRKQPGEAGKFVMAAFVMMIVASLMRAAMGLSYDYGFAHGADKNYVVLINSLFWVFGGLIYSVCRERSFAGEVDKKKLWRYGILSGALVTGIVLTMAQSLVEGEASVALPIAQMSFLVTGLLGVWLLKEKLTPMRIGAMLLGVAAILLLSL